MMAEQNCYIDWMKDFYKIIKEQNVTISDVYRKIIKGMGDRVVFFIGVLDDGRLNIYGGDDKCNEFDMSEHAEFEKIREAFRTVTDHGDDERCIEQCRVLGGKAGIYKVFYYSSSLAVSDIDSAYLSLADEAYYEWLSHKLSGFLAAKEVSEEEWGDFSGEDVGTICRNAADNLNKYMKSVLGVDLGILTELSGSYYEGKACECSIVFCTDDREEWDDLDGIALDQPIEINTYKIRNIRKILEMGGEGYCALAKRDSSGRWKIYGICKETAELERSLKFHILNHMVWRMEVGGKTSLIYNCGKYEIDSLELEVQMFSDKFEKVYGMEPDETVKDIFRRATKQKHGTIVIILDANVIEAETDRLINESTGMKVKNGNILGELVKNVTSIDGAMMIDENGSCSGIGLILDSNESVTGNPERGARYHSVLKYVKKWKNREIRCLGIVVSEDKTVDVISVNDRI